MLNLVRGNSLLSTVLIKPVLGRLVRGERCDAVVSHRLQAVAYICCNVSVAPFTAPDERMLEQFTVFRTIRFFFY